MALFAPLTVPPAGNNVFTTTLSPANYLLLLVDVGDRFRKGFDDGNQNQ